jgi:CheY-like chemotaxis protein
MRFQSLKSDASREEAQRIDKEPAGRVLIVDDIVDNRVVLARLFQRRGFEIGEAGDGEEALRLIEQKCFDVVLLDATMPGLAGDEALRRIRATWSADILPVIMVTAKAFTADVAKFLKLGANDCVTKPVDFAVALERVIKQVATTRRTRTAPPQQGARGRQEAARGPGDGTKRTTGPGQRRDQRGGRAPDGDGRPDRLSRPS